MAHPREILTLLDANARKSLSQNFLTSPHWAERLAESTISAPCNQIWEIGPGLGAITKPLVSLAKVPVTLFEYDRKLSEYLRHELPQTPLVEGDFLKADHQSYLKEDTELSVLSNLPYHLSSPILFLFVDLKKYVRRLTFTFQKEFADRLKAVPRSSEYGGLTVVVQLHFKVESLGIIPATAFYPAPSIASEALVFTPLPFRPGMDKVSALVKAAFAHRRKKLSRNLAEVFPQVDWNAAFASRGLSPDARAEELDKEAYLELASLLN